MKLVKSICVLLVTSLVLIGCSTSEKKEAPKTDTDWLSSVKQKYPSQQYIVGHGMGDNLEIAKQKARADLAKVFEVRVSEVASDTHQVVEEFGEQTSRKKAERSITTHTDEMLRGVQIAETWTDPNNNMSHALAALNRFSTSEALRKDIRALDEDTVTHVKKAQQSNDLLRTAAAAYHAYVAQAKRAELQNQLRVVDQSGQGMPPAISLSKFRSDFEQVLGRIHVLVNAEDKKTGSVVAAGISKAGFNSQSTTESGYILLVSLDRIPVMKRDGFYWLQATLNMELRENKPNGLVKGVEGWQMKVSATDENLVEKRLQDQIIKFNNRKMRDTILGFAITDYQNDF